MTDEEHKQFINEYCRNVAHKPMTKLCNSCEYLKFCARSGIEEVGCDRYKRDTTTNEEWFCNLSTEEKARFLACEFTVACDDYAYSNNKETWHEKYWVAWLKQPHTIKE